MTLKNYKTKPSVVIVYTGEGKGKTSASLGLMARALGSGWKVAFIQFIKHWQVGEHQFIDDIKKVYPDKLTFKKGGMGFYNAGDMSAKNISEQQHRQAANETFTYARTIASSGEFDLVICDEINNTIADGLLEVKDLQHLLDSRHAKTSLCLTGRNFPKALISQTDIATNMTVIKHHFDDGFIANPGIDY